MINKTTSPNDSEQLLHDIATPLLITQMNADLLAKYLPQLITALRNPQLNNELLLNDEKIIAALINAPSTIKNNLDVIQKNMRQLSNILENNNSNTGTHAPSISLLNSANASTLQIKKILLVEDETIHQDIGLNLLTPRYHVDCVNNGLEAINKCKQQHYDLILMDLQMPKMNGVEATTELRKIVSPDIIIIGLTSMPIGNKRGELLELGFTNFLEKPLKLENFQNILRLHINTD
ncbi:MAG: response regulator [Pseudomonadota bacterium]